MTTLDSYDAAILAELTNNGRASFTSLADRVNLSASAVQRRVQTMQANGVIKGFSVSLEPTSLGYAVRAFVEVTVDRREVRKVKKFRKAITDYPQVLSCHQLSGRVDFLLEVTAKDLGAFTRFIEDKILALEAVRDASSSIVLDEVKARTFRVRA